MYLKDILHSKMAFEKAPTLQEIRTIVENVVFLHGECDLLVYCMEPAASKIEELAKQKQKSKETKTTQDDFKAFLEDIYQTVNKCKNKGKSGSYPEHFVSYRAGLLVRIDPWSI